ncbi:Gfo/Idh/MocA family oxidoreductase [Candidatus Nanohalococcus occultus]|uniref:Gfo/Idh/MocA-like oxidoreductase N-terminal domain-containing protein n=1 Tax=Candidatus Nanohalococcus occultus TaxID=2978047 RepID=A0ABY8CFU1_9ARCH|nr:hypothetical protein SVXNc_0562 [Candidatus Nanohaloarchaeota archaeon SVXNc]
MKQVNVFQIGLGNFGRHGFEKFIEMHNHLNRADMEFHGLAERDFEKRQAAEKFAARNNVEIDTFKSVDELYRAASNVEGEVLIYDAGPTATHANHIYRSMNHGFYHVAEKPPSMTRDEHIKERKLAAGDDVVWKADFIERESPVVKQALKELQDVDIESIKVFRQSSMGVQKILDPIERSGVLGGDILDKMTHEIFVLDFLQAAGYEKELELVDAESEYFMPAGNVSDQLMRPEGGKTDSIEQSAPGKTWAAFKAGNVNVELNSSWLGAGKKARKQASRLDFVDHSPIVTESKLANDTAFLNEEARFFVTEGDRKLFGDMLHGRLFDLQTEEEIEVPELMHDQLYRVLRKSVLRAAGRDVGIVSDKDIDVFMNAVFDTLDLVRENSSGFYEELEGANRRVSRLVYEPNAIEDSEAESVTG